MKRSFPFDDLFSKQSKLHVGEKEVDQGVNRDLNMRTVYAKTMQLLMDGSRNLSNNNVTPLSRAKTTVAPPAEHSRTNSLRQMALTSFGGICHTRVTETSQAVGGAAAAQTCVACPSGAVAAAAAAANCSFCESPLCVACVATCVRCMSGFCRHCCVVVYEQHDDITVCLSCNR